jgi:transposase
MNYRDAAAGAGRRSAQAVANLVVRFNRDGLVALEPHGRGGPKPRYDAQARQRILAEARRRPDPERDGTASWSLMTLRRALRRAPDGFPAVSTYTIGRVLHGAGYRWLSARSWCETGCAVRKRRAGTVKVTDPDAEAKKKNLIERAYREGEQLGLAVWTQDEAGPYPTRPMPGQSWAEQGQAQRQPHEYVRNGTAKLLTLFCPNSGEVRAKGVTAAPNAMLHPWLQQELTAVLDQLPSAPVTNAVGDHAVWESWQQGLTTRITLPTILPPLRLLLVWDNLQGHVTPTLVLWLFSHGVMPLYTPLSGSWLNMAESIQRIISRRALAGQYLQTPQQIINTLEATVKGWNQDPTPFHWGGKRHARRLRSRQRQHALAGSGACTHRPLRHRRSVLQKSLSGCQVTH